MLYQQVTNANAVTHSIIVTCHVDVAYDYLSKLERWPEWDTSARHVEDMGDYWLVRTTSRDIAVRPVFDANKKLLDHYIRVDSKREIFVPFRVVPHELGCKVTLTLLKSQRSQQKTNNQDISRIQQELLNIKLILEQNITCVN